MAFGFNIEDTVVSRAIITSFMTGFEDVLESDVAVVGGGPAGLAAACLLAEKGLKTVLFERKLSLGGGMWGGGMMFNRIVFQEEARPLFERFGVSSCRYAEGYYTASSVEAVGALIVAAARAGVRIMNMMMVEDIMLRGEKVAGLVINWTAVEGAGLHVDPLAVASRAVIDATGHEAVVVNCLVRKLGAVLNTPSGRLEGEKPMWAARGEEQILENTRLVYPGLYVAGMAANAVYGGLRMGPIFGGMLLSGEKVAQMVAADLAAEK